MPPSPSSDRFTHYSGHLGASAAFLSWGLLPFYWKGLAHVPTHEIVCYRIVSSLLVTAAILTLQRRWPEATRAVTNPRTLLTLMVNGALLAINWSTYIWAVNAGYVLDASLGYYINPLVYALLGFVFLRDRLRPWQTVAIGLAFLGVANQVINYGRFPWVALVLALTFGTYGLLRKTALVKPLPGLFFEMLTVAVPAAGYLAWLGWTGASSWGSAGAGSDLLLAGTGLVTALPLLWFGHGAKRLRLVTVGLHQYTTPSCFFLLGVFVFAEPFSWTRFITFCLIWTGIGVYTWEGLSHARRNAADRTP